MIYAPQTTKASLIIEPVSASVSPDDVFVSFSTLREPAILESLIHPHTYARFSIFAFDPIDQFTAYSSDLGCPFQELADRSAAYATNTDKSLDFPFSGGWIGYFTYEAGLRLENILARMSHHSEMANLPIAKFKLYDTAAVYDHQQYQWLAVAADLSSLHSKKSRPPPAKRIQTISALLQQSPCVNILDIAPPPSVAYSNMSYDQYIQKVTLAKDYISAGDIFEVNVSQRFETQVDTTPFETYRRLRTKNPSSHAAFLPWDDVAVMSSSPELFLKLSGNHIVTRPIKGTTPRGCDSLSDLANHRALVSSEKDRAELTMIIDLLRNDLGRVCECASVNVRESATIETLPHVFHQVATIEGTLRKQGNWLDVLRATFPGGSITGTPKIRAMQIISQLENVPRGVYCGSIGLIELNGNMSLNIAIRTLVQQGNLVRFNAGGAIVADSDPQQEYEEILAKAKGMMQALNCTLVPSSSLSHKLTHA